MSKDDNYEIGHKKPPKAYQFPKGKSGNPKGRKPKSIWPKTTDDKDLEVIYAMHREVTVRENGKPKKKQAIVALYDQLVAKAFKGDYRATKMAIEMYHAAVNRNEDKRISLAETIFEVERNMEKYYQRKARENSLRRN